MSVKKENVCRLCFNDTENEFEVIDEITKKIFEVLSLKMYLDLNKSLIICEDCMEIVKKIYRFKSTCINTEEYIRSFTVDERTAEFELKDILQEDGKDIETFVDKNFSICRFCMNRLDKNSVMSIDILMEDVVFVEMLPVLIPQMDLNITKNPVICIPCKENLEAYFNFVRKCLDIESKINKDCVKPISIMNFLSEESLKYSNSCTQTPEIKQEADTYKKIENVNFKACDVSIKTEEFDIKDEDFNINKNNSKNLSDITDKYDEQSHISSESGRYKCEVCNHETRRKHDFKCHMVTHKSATEVEIYYCASCPYESRHKKYLKRHMLVHKDISEAEMYKCTRCTYETKHKYWLKRHMGTHKDISEVRMYECPTCTYQTYRKDILKCHVLIHKNASEVEIYKCTICTYETRHKNCLNSHMRTHKDKSEVVMYKCAMCGYETRFKQNLKKHTLIHEDSSEVYKCAKCTYETKRKDVLKKHLLIHKDTPEIEKHECTMCTFQTKYKQNLKYHMLAHKDTSQVEMYKCARCTYETKHKNGLKRHVWLSHDMLDI